MVSHPLPRSESPLSGPLPSYPLDRSVLHFHLIVGQCRPTYPVWPGSTPFHDSDPIPKLDTSSFLFFFCCNSDPTVEGTDLGSQKTPEEVLQNHQNVLRYGVSGLLLTDPLGPGQKLFFESLG